MVCCSEKIVHGLSQDPRAMATALLAKGFISDETLEEINEVKNTNQLKGKSKVSLELLSSILTDIKISRTYFKRMKYCTVIYYRHTQKYPTVSISISEEVYLHILEAMKLLL